MPVVFALLAGIVFGAGLAISDMVNPARVLNFFDVAGSWDPTLLFVMGGALATTASGYRLVFARGSPLIGKHFTCRPSRQLTHRSLAGRYFSALAGV